MSVVYEDQKTNVAWFSDPIPNGTAKNNFDRIIELRKLFCHPLTIKPDGHLNKKYFSNIDHETAMNWNDIEMLQLYDGIFRFGVDSVEKWNQIKAECLPQRDFIEIRLKLTQLFGCQDLSVYKGRKFSTEKEITDEFEKNKLEAQQSGCWNEECQVKLKPTVSALTAEDEKELEKKEIGLWTAHIYNDPTYVYRTESPTKKKGSKSKTKSKRENKKKQAQKKKANKAQSNTLDAMLKKQDKTEDAETSNTDTAPPVEPATTNNNKNKSNGNKNKKKKKNTRKSDKPLLPSDSEDEEMLCVE